MQKAGYIQRTGCKALDSEGNTCEVIDLHILGSRYAIRMSDLARGVSGHAYIQIETITREWNYYLGITCGLAHVSASGKALNIELFDAGSFTISLSALRSVMYGKQRNAAIARIPEMPVQPAWKPRRINDDQQRISASV